MSDILIQSDSTYLIGCGKVYMHLFEKEKMSLSNIPEINPKVTLKCLVKSERGLQSLSLHP